MARGPRRAVHGTAASCGLRHPGRDPGERRRESSRRRDGGHTRSADRGTGARGDSTARRGGARRRGRGGRGGRGGPLPVSRLHRRPGAGRIRVPGAVDQHERGRHMGPAALRAELHAAPTRCGLSNCDRFESRSSAQGGGRGGRGPPNGSPDAGAGNADHVARGCRDAQRAGHRRERRPADVAAGGAERLSATAIRRDSVLSAELRGRAAPRRSPGSLRPRAGWSLGARVGSGSRSPAGRDEREQPGLLPSQPGPRHRAYSGTG